jgi:hypothetical protein
LALLLFAPHASIEESIAAIAAQDSASLERGGKSANRVTIAHVGPPFNRQTVIPGLWW